MEKRITREQMDDMLYKKSFQYLGVTVNNKIYHYSHTALGIIVKVYVETNEFEISYPIPNSFISLTSGKISPFYEETPKYDMFTKVYKQFLRAFSKLVE